MKELHLASLCAPEDHRDDVRTGFLLNLAVSTMSAHFIDTIIWRVTMRNVKFRAGDRQHMICPIGTGNLLMRFLGLESSH
jgi:hypothetical protein